MPQHHTTQSFEVSPMRERVCIRLTSTANDVSAFVGQGLLAHSDLPPPPEPANRRASEGSLKHKASERAKWEKAMSGAARSICDFLGITEKRPARRKRTPSKKAAVAHAH